MNFKIDRERLCAEIETLALISDAEAAAVTRIVFTPADLKARAWLNERCEAAGLAVRQDSIGNTFARWPGSDPTAPAVVTGSHIDAIPNAGKYDGVVGVLGGLEAIRALKESGFRPKTSIELLVFTSEEPTRFGIGCLGSRLLSGALPPESARSLIDKDGFSLEQVRLAIGLRGELESVRLAPDRLKAFVELHIEQGPILEREHIPLGVVTRIAAPASFYVHFEGVGGHAGGVLMPDRRDALVAAAELILEIENAAKSSGAADTVATVGMCDVFPGAINSIPSRVRISVDVRDTDLVLRDETLRAVEAACDRIATRRELTFKIERLNADAPAICAPELVEIVSESCRRHKVSFMRMVSRAYHDSLFMACIAPTAMIFVPCRNGYSHRPDEYASAEDIVRGVQVLAETLAELSS